MKKLKAGICVLTAAVMAMLSVSIGFTAYADVLEEQTVERFVDNACDVIQDYDSEKVLIPSEKESNEPDFQTCRLIVKADGSFDTFGALEHIKGFKNIHILQYKDENSAKQAYEALENEPNVLSVSVDEIVSPLQADDPLEGATEVFPESSNGHLCDWATERTQSAQVIEYISENDIPLTDITVGVIDMGVDYNHEFLKDRIVRTHFNSSTDGNENDELELNDGHGTGVSSVIVDNSPESVSVAVYRVLDDRGNNSALGVQLGMIAAVDDGVDIISISLGIYVGADLIKEAIDYAEENGIIVVCGAGNDSDDVVESSVVPAEYEETVTVTASSKDSRNCGWANYGLYIDVSAPGEDVNVAVPGNRYIVWSGTSFSCPSVAAAFATIKSVHYEYSYDEIRNILNETATPLITYAEDIFDTPLKTFALRTPDLQYGQYGNGLVQVGAALGIESVPSPTASLESGNYADEVTVELYSDLPIYYTLDGTYPTTQSALYTEPLTFTEDTDLRAVAYDENSILKYSTEFEGEYQIFTTGTDDMFEIDETGCITAYSGGVSNLIVPEEIQGIEVVSFTAEIFNDGILGKLILPETLKEIPEYAFYNNDIITYINTGGANILTQGTFSGCNSLCVVDLPKAETIERHAFSSTSNQYGNYFAIDAPELKQIEDRGFRNSSAFDLVAPKLEAFYGTAFDQSDILYADFPNLKISEKSIPFYQCVFDQCCPSIINLPNLESSEMALVTGGFKAQVVNLPKFTGTIVEKEADRVRNVLYCNITKESAALSNFEYYNVTDVGGSIRVTDAGLRFGYSYNEEQTEEVEEYGFVYAAGDVDPYTLYVEDVDNKSVYKLVANNRITHEDNVTTFNLVLIDIPQTAYDSQVSARAYVKVDGIYYYSDKLCYSFNDVATAVLADDEIDQNTKDALRELY